MLDVICAALIFAFLLQLAFLLPIDPDEREHLNAAYLITQGQTPYKDFFEHHHPLLWYLATPIVPFFENSAQIWYLLRAFQAIILFLTSIYIYKLAILSGLKSWAGYAACLIYFCFDIARHLSLEFRPDTLMICFFISGLYYFYLYLENQKRATLTLAFALFLLSFLTFQKAPLLFAIPCLYIFIKSFRNKQIRTDTFFAALPSACVLLLLIFYLWQQDLWQTFLELNWLLNFKLNKEMTFIYNPLTPNQIKTFEIYFILACGCLWFAKSLIIKHVSLLYIIYACFVYSWKLRHLQYMLPLYPFAALVSGYIISAICRHKVLLLKCLTCLLLLGWFKYVYNEIYTLKKSRQNFSAHLIWEQKALELASPNDLVLYAKPGEQYFGGLRKQPTGYYGFSIGGAAKIDYNNYHRHPYPNLRQIIKDKKPKIVFNGHWNDCSLVEGKCLITQTLDTEFMREHYIDKGIFYLRKD